MAKKTDRLSEQEINTRHAEKMAKKKAARDKIMAGKTADKGLIIIHTGKGKGKSTAGFGMIFRSIGHGFKTAVVQFVKGAWETGERTVLEKFPETCTIKAMGGGFTWETQNRERDIAMARAAWDEAKALIISGDYKTVLLDEINIVLRYDYIPVSEVVEFLSNEKPKDVHVILTGRNAAEELIEIADLVTEMTQIKHPFRGGIKAQPGIEF